MLRRRKMAVVAAEYLQSCRDRGLAPGTIKKYRWVVAVLSEWCPYLPRRGRDLLPVVTRPEHGLQTRQVLRTGLGTFFRWCGRRYNWPNPVLQLDRMPRLRRRLPRVLSELEVDQLLGACLNQRDRALVILPLETGLRLGEVAALMWGDIGPDYIAVRDGKSDDRVVPLSPEVKRLLLGLGDGRQVWMGRKGPLGRSGVQQAYRRLFRRAGLEGAKLGPHLLRHTFATQYIAGGGNLFSLMEILGHTRISTTQIYVTLARHQVGQNHALFSPVATWGLLKKLD